MEKKKTLEEQLKNLRIRKDDPKALKKKIQELEKENQSLKQKPNIASSKEKICPVLKRKTGDGRIEIVNGKVACEYVSICKTAWWEEYSRCKISKGTCPYSSLPKYSEE